MIFNKTKNREISPAHIDCRSGFSKMRGLMFRLRPVPLVFHFKKEKIVPLHMLFVFFSIDVLYLNSKKVVVGMKRNFRPFKFYSPSVRAGYVVELPAGTISKAGVSLGDRIKF